MLKTKVGVSKVLSNPKTLRKRRRNYSQNKTALLGLKN